MDESRSRCTVGLLQANLIAVGLLAAALAVVAGGHAVFWGRSSVSMLDEVFASNLFFLAIAIAVLLHEALHAVGFRYFGGAPWRAIRIGIQWRTVTPFARAIIPVTARAYRWTAALPGLVLGALPILAGILFDSPLASGFGAVMLAGAGGDAAILWATRRVPSLALVLDSDTVPGCSILPTGSSN